MAETGKVRRVNWVICPSCTWRYYLGAPILLVSGSYSICPKCRLEFDPRPHLLEPLSEMKVHELH
jgi:hypothetical protein